MRMHSRALALTTILLATQCSEWIPATVAEATGQERVRVRQELTLDEPPSTESDVRVTTIELEFPSRRTLLQLSRRGGHFEVRHSNADHLVLPVTVAIIGTAALVWLVALAAQYKPSFDMTDWRSLGGLIPP